MMESTAEVVIIGGGVIGLSLAYHLAARGLRSITVLERDRCGHGATLKATGGFRCQFGTPINVQLSLLSRRFWVDFGRAVGGPAVFTPRGYLFLIATPEQWAAHEGMAAMQRALGAPTMLVTPTDIAFLAPGTRTDDRLGGAYCPLDGILDVPAVMEGLRAAGERLGVRLHEHVAVTGIDTRAGRVVGARTTAGPVATPMVVNAAGNEAAAVGALVGVDLPVRPERRQAAVTVPSDAVWPTAAWTIDLLTGCYARPDAGGGAVIGGGDRGVAAGPGDETVDAAGIDRLRDLIGQRFPRLAGVPLARAWVGRRPMAPDDHAILGATAVAGFLTACGAGSHGLMHAPAIGRLLAEVIVDGEARGLDIGPLGADRFARGDLLSEGVLF
jgi:sarcosine oxidase, subunit beta